MGSLQTASSANESRLYEFSAQSGGIARACGLICVMRHSHFPRNLKVSGLQIVAHAVNQQFQRTSHTVHGENRRRKTKPLGRLAVQITAKRAFVP